MHSQIEWKRQHSVCIKSVKVYTSIWQQRGQDCENLEWGSWGGKGNWAGKTRREPANQHSIIEITCTCVAICFASLRFINTVLIKVGAGNKASKFFHFIHFFHNIWRYRCVGGGNTNMWVNEPNGKSDKKVLHKI